MARISRAQLDAYARQNPADYLSFYGDADPLGLAPELRQQIEANQPTLFGEFKKGAGAGVDSIQAGFYGAGALAADAVGAEGLRDELLGGYQRNVQEGQENAAAVGSFTDIGSGRDAALYLAQGLGQLAPSAVLSLAGFGVGGLLARGAAAAAGRAAAARAGAITAERALIQRAAREAGAKVLTRAGAAGGFAAQTPVTSGQVFGENAGRGEYDPLKAFGAGVTSSALDLVPEIGLAKRVLGAGAGSLPVFVARQGGREALTEGGQQAIQRAATGKEILSYEGLTDIADAAILGGLGGGVLSVAAGAPSSAAPRDSLEVALMRASERRVANANARGITFAPRVAGQLPESQSSEPAEDVQSWLERDRRATEASIENANRLHPGGITITQGEAPLVLEPPQAREAVPVSALPADYFRAGALPDATLAPLAPPEARRGIGDVELAGAGVDTSILGELRRPGPDLFQDRPLPLVDPEFARRLLEPSIDGVRSAPLELSAQRPQPADAVAADAVRAQALHLARANEERRAREAQGRLRAGELLSNADRGVLEVARLRAAEGAAPLIVLPGPEPTAGAVGGIALEPSRARSDKTQQKMMDEAYRAKQIVEYARAGIQKVGMRALVAGDQGELTPIFQGLERAEYDTKRGGFVFPLGDRDEVLARIKAATTKAPDVSAQVLDGERDDEGVVRDTRRFSRTMGWEGFPPAIVTAPVGAARQHPDYAAAKAGDAAAAERLAENVLTEDSIRQIGEQIGNRKPIVVPVVSEESTGANRIPMAAAARIAGALGLDTDTGIVQRERVNRGGRDGFGRLAAQPTFDGKVEPGRDYVLVDDTLTQGGTFAQLKEHIEQGGGRVILATALTGKQYSAQLAPGEQTITDLRAKYGELEPEWRRRFGYGFDGFTESEARYLLKSGHPPDAIRDRVLAQGRSGSDDVADGSATPEARPVREGQGEQSPLIKPRFARGDSQPTGLTPVQVRSILERAIGKDAVAALERTKLLTIAERQADAAPGVAGVIRGVHDGKTNRVTLIAENLEKSEVVGVLLHEMGEHAGFKSMLGGDYAKLTARYQRLLANGGKDEALIREAEARAQSEAGARERAGEEPDSELLESERLAYTVQLAAERIAKGEPVTLGIRGLVRDFVAAVKAWLLSQRGMLKLPQAARDAIIASLSPQDFAALALRAVREQASGKMDTRQQAQRSAGNERSNDPRAVAGEAPAAESEGLPGNRGRADGLREPVRDVEASVRPSRTDSGLDTGRAPGADAAGTREGDRARGLDQPLRGAPRELTIRGKTISLAPLPKARAAAQKYMNDAGLRYTPPQTYAKVKGDPVGQARAERIAAAFAEMRHDPSDPAVAESYQAMIRETIAQYRAVLATGLKVEFIDLANGNPYDTPYDVLRDVAENNHMWVFSTRDGFGSGDRTSDNPLEAETEFEISGQKALANDLFRVVHDYFGHVKDGNGFFANGEENAWRSHSAMYSPLARKAMTNETRGQNSYLNFGPNRQKNQGATAEDTIYADQKIGLLPDWVVSEGAGDAGITVTDAESAGGTPQRVESVSDLSGDKINRSWTAFAADSGTLGVPRAEMPQIRAEHRGALVQFLKGRGIAHEQDREVDPRTLKPTQAEFSPAKVREAQEYQGGDRSILVSADGHVLDGHHQWLAKLESGEPIKVIRLDAPIRDLLADVRDFPSAEAAKGATAPREPADGVRYSRTVAGASPYFIAKSEQALGQESRAEAAERLFVNAFNRVRKAQDYLREKGAVIDDSSDVVQAEALYHGRAGERLRQLDLRFVQPITNAMRDAGLTMKQVDDFLYAKHAPERNRQVAKVNPGVLDGSGMSNQEARQVLGSFTTEQTQALEQIAQRVYAMNQARIQLMRDAGLEAHETLEAWQRAYRNYVPLKTVTEEEAAGQGMGFDIRGGESKRALGRGSRATSPLLVSIQDYQRTVARAGKAEVGRKLLALARQDQNRELFEIKDAGDFMTQVFDKRVGGVRDAVDFGAIRDAFAVKVGGDVKYVVAKDAILAEQLKKLGVEGVPRVLEGVNKLTRLLSRLYTQYNPSFIPVNAFRDALAASINSMAYDGIKPGQVLSGLPKAWRAIKMVAFEKPGITPSGAAWEGYYRDFLEDGAGSGSMGLNNLQDLIRRMEREVNPQGKADAAMNALGGLGKLVERSNQIVEDASRLSVYVRAREAGYSREKAAGIAKEITVNFNRRGELGSAFNAGFMFWNASIQGTSALYRHAKKSPKVMSALVGLGSLGFALEALNLAMGDDDDTGDAIINKIGDFEADHSALLLLGKNGERVKIPLPYGYNVPYAFGRRIARLLAGEDSAGKVAAAMVGSAIESFSPFGDLSANQTSSQMALRYITPTLATPFVDAAFNKDRYGRPLVKERFRGQENIPDSQMFFRGVSAPARGLAETLNEITGGSKVRAGAIDINPEYLDYWARFTTGGLGTSVLGVVNQFGEDATVNRLPVVKALVGGEQTYYVSSRYSEVKPELAELIGRMEDRDPDLTDAELTAAREAKQAERLLSRLYRRRKVLEQNGAEVPDLILNGIEAQQRRAIRVFNRLQDAA